MTLYLEKKKTMKLHNAVDLLFKIKKKKKLEN